MTDWMQHHLGVTACLVGGVVLAAAQGIHTGASVGTILYLLALAIGGSLIAAAAGGIVLHRNRRRPVRVQVLLTAIVGIVTTLGGITFASATMFISAHDLGALLAITAVSAAVGIGAALQLANSIDLGTRGVRDLTERLGGSIDASRDVDLPPGPPEFQALAGEVAELPQKLEELRRRAEALERSRTELVAWVSHDLRSPLATIRAMAEALDDGVVSDQATYARYHHQIRRDAERLSALVDDLFELSRINSGALAIHRDRVSLQDVVADVIESAQHRADIAGVRLIDRVSDVLTVEVAVAELVRVLHNVIDNAIRHTPRGGAIVIELAAEDDIAIVSVQDECGGIPDADLDRVFDVAFRGDAARSRNAQGGGLGLAIAKGLVEACAGAIDVDNHSNGCRFTVRLPLRGD